MIPENITSEHINSAIHEIEINGVPKNRKSHKYSLVSNGNYYPPKYVVALANKYANDVALLSSVFNGGTETNAFLQHRGFEITDVNSKSVSARKDKLLIYNNHMEEKSEKGKAISIPVSRKMALQKLLEERFGTVETEVSFDWLIVPDWDSMDSDIRKIAEELVIYRDHKQFISPGRHLNIDYFVPSQNVIIEYDERQHFTIPRAIALCNYPAGLGLAFDTDTWIATCEAERAVDPDPVYRDEQRAFYDSLRDILAVRNCMTVLRINDKDYDWTKADAGNRLTKLLSANTKPGSIDSRIMNNEDDAHNKQESSLELISACYCNLQRAYRMWASQFNNQQEVIEWLEEKRIINEKSNIKDQDHFDLRSSHWNSITIPVLKKVASSQIKKLETGFNNLFSNHTVESEDLWYLLFFIHPGMHELWHFNDHFPKGYSCRLAKLIRSHRLGLKGLKRYLNKTNPKSLRKGYPKGCAKVAFRHIHLHPDTSLWEIPHIKDTTEAIKRLDIGTGDISIDEKNAVVALSHETSFGFDAWLKNYAPCAINEGPVFSLKQGEYFPDCFKEIVELLHDGKANQSELRTILRRYHKVEE